MMSSLVSMTIRHPPFAIPLEDANNRAITFGGAFFLHAFLHKTGMMDLIDGLPFGNKATTAEESKRGRGRPKDSKNKKTKER